jgi:hypothetical protein
MTSTTAENALEARMITICKRTLNEEGNVADTAITSFAFNNKSDAVSYLNKITRFLRPHAGYEGEQGYWWVRHNGVVTRLTIQS